MKNLNITYGAQKVGSGEKYEQKIEKLQRAQAYCLSLVAFWTNEGNTEIATNWQEQADKASKKLSSLAA